MPLTNGCRHEDITQIAMPTPFSFTVSVRSDQWCVFTTPSVAIVHAHCKQFKFRVFGGHSWGVMNSGVSVCNNSMVAHVRWVFQVAQGSMETLFTRGGKRLHHFVVDLFRKRCISSELLKFYKSHFRLFFWTHCKSSDLSDGVKTIMERQFTKFTFKMLIK